MRVRTGPWTGLTGQPAGGRARLAPAVLGRGAEPRQVASAKPRDPAATGRLDRLRRRRPPSRSALPRGHMRGGQRIPRDDDVLRPHSPGLGRPRACLGARQRALSGLPVAGAAFRPRHAGARDRGRPGRSRAAAICSSGAACSTASAGSRRCWGPRATISAAVKTSISCCARSGPGRASGMRPKCFSTTTSISSGCNYATCCTRVTSAPVRPCS